MFPFTISLHSVLLLKLEEVLIKVVTLVFSYFIEADTSSVAHLYDNFALSSDHLLRPSFDRWVLNLDDSEILYLVLLHSYYILWKALRKES